MTLRQFLAALASNTGTAVTLKTGETEILTFNVEGYEAVESDILAYTVSAATLVKGPNVKLVISIAAATEGGE